MNFQNIEKFIINLPERSDRLKTTLKELKNVENCRIYPAIRNKTQGFKGLSDTVKEIIKIAKKENYKRIVIFEDDVKITSKKSIEKFQMSMNSLPPDWDILLGGVYSILNGDKIWNEHLKLLKDFSSLHFTLINHTSYDIILEHDVKKKKHLDRYLGEKSKNGELKVFLTWPMIAVQHAGKSDITNKMVNYERLLKKFEILK